MTSRTRAALKHAIRLFATIVALCGAQFANADTIYLRVVGDTTQGLPTSTKLAESLDRELGQTVTLVSSSALCPALCIEIGFDNTGAAGPSVLVRVIDHNGKLRERSLLLPTDKSQWLEASILLAGNLVRDEAATFIAQLTPALPAPVLAPAPAPAPVLEPALEPAISPRFPALYDNTTPHTPFSIGLVPPLSLDFGRTGKRSHDFSLDLLVGVSGGSSAFSLSGLIDVEHGDVSGAQIGGLVAAARNVSGIQVAGIASIARDLGGVQVSGILSRAIGVGGIQIAGLVNVGRRSSVQIGGLINVAERWAGWQIAGGSNYARKADVQISGGSNILFEPGSAAHLQIAGALNDAERVAGAQIAAINVADHVDGLQLGAVNIAAKSSDGVQIGAINIASKSDGVSIGAINIIPGGRTELDVYADSDGTGTLLFRHGSKRWHNVYGIAGNRGTTATALDDEDTLWMYGLGMGTGAPVWAGYFDFEAMAWQVHHGEQSLDALQILNQVRATYAYSFGKVALIGGFVLNAFVSDDSDENTFTFSRGTYLSQGEGDHVRVRSWVTGFIGLRF